MLSLLSPKSLINASGLGSRPLKRLNISLVGQLPPNAKKVSRKLKSLNNKYVNIKFYYEITLKYYLIPEFFIDSSGTLNDWYTSAAIILDHNPE